MSVGAKDVVFTTAKVGVDLAGEERILGDVRLARIIVQWQHEQPYYADNDAQGGEVGRDLEYAGITAEPKKSWSCGQGQYQE